MSDCTHGAIDWKVIESIGVEGTILKLEAARAAFGDGVRIKAADCTDCKKAIVEITPEGK